MAFKFKAPIDLGRFVVRNLIGEVFGNNIIRISADLFNYRQIVQSINSENPDRITGIKAEPVLKYTTAYDGNVKQRIFNLYGHEIRTVFNPALNTQCLYMDATEAKLLHEPMVTDKVQDNSWGFSAPVAA